MPDTTTVTAGAIKSAIEGRDGRMLAGFYTDNAIVHGGRLDPGVELLPKPYTREALAYKIRRVLAKS